MNKGAYEIIKLLIQNVHQTVELEYADGTTQEFCINPEALLAELDKGQRLEEEAATLACFCADLCPNVPSEVNCQSCDDCPGMDWEESDKPEAWRKLARKKMRGE